MGSHESLDALSRAVDAASLSESAADRIRAWLTQSPYAEYRAELTDRIRRQAWQELDELFAVEIPFGTAGRRGRMAPLGTNAINARTIGETVQALATYVRQRGDCPQLTAAVAYDTRHRSREFAELAAGILAASGFHVFFFDGIRATPQLSTTVRHLDCACGVVISASHNPPTDNAIKVFWRGGAQLRPPHDAAIFALMQELGEIEAIPFADAVAAGNVEFCQEAMDAFYREQVRQVGTDGVGKARALRIVYSPLHGVGLTSIAPILESVGYRVQVFAPHATPDPDFSEVPDQIANPENPKVFERIVEMHGADADLILASDPDADRIGCTAPLSTRERVWRPLTGNQIGALLAAFLMARRQRAGKLHPQDFVVTTLVSSHLMLRIAESHGIQAVGDVLTGFKWISQVIDDRDPEHFVFGFEEAHGYLAGTYARDKDGGIAALLLAELAEELLSRGQTLHDELARLFQQHGFHDERTLAITMPGVDGLQQMQRILDRVRADPPVTVGHLAVTQIRDFLLGEVRDAAGRRVPLQGPTSNLLLLDLERPGYRLAIRPSGTEPKIKFYLFAVESLEAQDLEQGRAAAEGHLDAMEADVRQLVV